MNYKDIKSEIFPIIKECLLENFNIKVDDIKIEKTNKSISGDITVLLFPLVKLTKNKPDDLGKIIGDYLLAKYDIFSHYNIVKGFLNFTISDEYWKSFVTKFDYSKPINNKKDNGCCKYL